MNRVDRPVDDWEEWEDDQVVTPVDPGEHGELCQPSVSLPQHNTTTISTRASRISTAKIRRLKSRQRQKAQNAKAGIRLITDMSLFRRDNHVANDAHGSPRARAGKFVDAAALRALEGEPNSASVGNWNWLMKKSGKSPMSAAPDQDDGFRDQGPSPEDGPIAIGISVASEDMEARDAGPVTVSMTNKPSLPQEFTSNGQTHTAEKVRTVPDPNSQKSVWSPDTPNTSLSLGSSQAASSMHSQAPISRHIFKEHMPPAVPALPNDDHKRTTTPLSKITSVELGKSPQCECESDTPYTLFEEDGIPSPQRLIKAKEVDPSPDSAASASRGWWDHVITPFVEKKMSFSSRNGNPGNPNSSEERERAEHSMCQDNEHRPVTSFGAMLQLAAQAPVVQAPASGRHSPTCSDNEQDERDRPCPVEAILPVAGSGSEATPRIVVAHDCTNTPDYPPPYSPPKKQHEGKLARFRAMLPPSHPLHSRSPSAPSSRSHGLAATMTSQSGVLRTNDDSSATARTQAPTPIICQPLPIRPTGTFVPAEHVHPPAGTRHKIERQRRRHEKEDMVARRAGGFWRGRGCIPSKGCFGRTGREGRQRRRVWMAICGGVLALLLLLIILLFVFLTRHASTAQPPSIWVNLTDYPPMPTGVLTVVGPDNTAANSGCTAPSTLWSCSLPKDSQASVAPYRPNQPTIMMQIQWDNGTDRAWNVPDGDAPAASVARRAYGAASFARAALRRREQSAATRFVPNPAPPAFKEMWFLGETTDDIKSDRKGGEPAPFYISLLRSANATVPTARLSRRESSPYIGQDAFKNLIPPPDVEADGTSVPAVMMPNPVQQPVRLFDRSLPTEHYGFYTYFKKTIFLKSVTIQNQTADAIPLDEDGGCRKTEAAHLVTWGETRLHVQIWTRRLKDNSSSLLGADGHGATGQLVRPGTMPYPVTITQDTHGGAADKKLVWDRLIDERLRVQTDKAQALVNDMGIGGTWINHRSSGDAKLGGFDGGTGGCRCEWVNWV